MNGLNMCSKDFNPHVLYFWKNVKNRNTAPLPLHDHDYLFINYVTSGSAFYTVGAHEFIATKGDVVIINAHQMHTRRALTDEFNVFDIGIEDIHIKDLPTNCLVSEKRAPLLPLVNYSSEIYELYRDILNLQLHQELGWKLLVKAQIMKMLVLILKEMTPAVSSVRTGFLQFDSYEKEAITHTMIVFIQEHYKTKITLDTLTRHSYLSSVYISKVFKEATGETPINYLIKIRIDKAKELLAEDRLSMKEIAIEVGYDDYYYFSKLFKKNTGLSPTQYRELNDYAS